MKIRSISQLLFSGLCSAAVALLPQTSHAQGLIWQIPEPGAWVRYTGEYRQVTAQPQSTEGDVSLQWQRIVELRCLSKTEAEWRGETVPCVWIELESSTGQQVDGQFEAGPGATRIFKLLVPEAAILGKEFFDLEIPQAFLPIIEGYRQIGTGDPEPIAAEAFQSYPLFSQVLVNEQASLAGEESAQAITGNYDADLIENTVAIEDNSARTTNETRLWISPDVPFGPVKWTVRVTRESKTLVDTRDQFQKVSEINIQMQAAQIGTDAVSKLAVP